MNSYQQIWKPLLFQLDAEQAHHVSATLLNLCGAIPPVRSLMKQMFVYTGERPTEKVVAGIRFPNPVGLAAGFDKNATMVDALPLLGFGFAEIGTVTPRPQKGNPRPRLFRIPEEGAILNRMGFNNDGVQMVAKRLAKRKNNSMIIGGNIGRNKITTNEDAHKDYLFCFEYLQDLVDYFTVNVSSPNTPGLRQLLEKEPLTVLLETVMNQNRKRKEMKPVFLKISPDLEEDQLGHIAEVCIQTGVSGLVITNTTVSKESLRVPQKVEALGAGGLSGNPVQKLSQQKLQSIRKLSTGLAIMSSGGIMNPEDAESRFSDGADLVQLYTGFVYFGPSLPLSILRKLY
jgi:dihydroorotate dehydrogenase